ncbi:hypothetical protein BaRGS_00028284, partial [Batillaria attramentaria]
EFCTLGGQRYDMGQTWHPDLKPFGQNACINCTCHQGGQVECRAVECPRPDCEEPKILPGECCATCDDFDNLPPTVGTKSSEEDDSRRPGCSHDGHHYHDGDVFPSNSTGLRPTRRDQCVMCVCAEGTVLCQLKTCLPTKCKKFKAVPDDCCPQCAEESLYIDPHYLLSDTKEDNSTEADCTSPNGVHRNGTSWNPAVGPDIETISCVLCTCLNGHVNCSRLECPSEASLPCKRPRNIRGSCCKQCPARKRKNRKRKPKKNNGKNKRRKGKKGRRHKHKCKNKGRPEVHPDRKPDNTSVAAILSELCLPRRTGRLVYREKGDSFETLVFDDIQSSSATVEMLRWAVVNGRELQDTERKLLNASEFRQTVKCSQIIGATNTRGFKKFMKKMDGKLKRCKRRKKPCTRKTLDKLIKRDRRLKPVPTKHVCGE